jgi:hypothetical protein
MVSDWLTLSFAGLVDFTMVSMVLQGFSDKSDTSDHYEDLPNSYQGTRATPCGKSPWCPAGMLRFHEPAGAAFVAVDRFPDPSSFHVVAV